MTKKQPPQPHLSASDKIGQDLARAALEKQRRGEKPTAREQAALRDIEKKREEETRWRYYATVPQKHFRALAGERQTKQLQDFESRHGIKCTGPTISLFVFVKGVFDWFATNSRRIRESSGDDDLMMAGDGRETPAQRRYREAKAGLAELDLAERAGQLVRKEVIRPTLQKFAAILRGGIEQLVRDFGEEPAAIVRDCIIDAMAAADGLDRGGGEGTAGAETNGG